MLGRIFGVLLLMYGAAFAADDQRPAGKPAELKVLEKMIGKWSVHCTESVDGKESTITGTMTSEWMLNGNFVQCRGVRNQENIEHFQIIGFDVATKEYRLWFFDSSGLTCGPAKGHWDEKTQTMAWRDTSVKGVVLTNDLRFADDDTQEFTVVVARADGVTLARQKGKSTRCK